MQQSAKKHESRVWQLFALAASLFGGETNSKAVQFAPFQGRRKKTGSSSTGRTFSKRIARRRARNKVAARSRRNNTVARRNQRQLRSWHHMCRRRAQVERAQWNRYRQLARGLTRSRHA